MYGGGGGVFGGGEQGGAAGGIGEEGGAWGGIGGGRRGAAMARLISDSWVHQLPSAQPHRVTQVLVPNGGALSSESMQAMYSYVLQR